MDELLLINEIRPTRSDAVRNRDHILRIARELFNAHGVEAVTMTTIAQAAGVGKGTLYRNFPDKPALCEELLDHEQRELQDRTLAQLRAVPYATIDELTWFLENVLRFVWDNLDFISGEGFALPLDNRAHLWWRQTIRGLIVQIAPNADAEYLTDALYVLLDPRVMKFQRDVRGYDLTRITDGLIYTARQLLR